MSRHARSMFGCCALLFVAQYALYSVNFHRFFQGDAIFWMFYRFRTFGDFFNALGTLDIAHWYRPLSNRMIPSLFYPLWGLEPYGYHLVIFICFFAVSCLVFGFLHSITGKLSVAFPAAFYFSIHSSNVYTTYDFAFAPELFYVFFYVASVWLFIEGERRSSLKLRMASAAAFALSLMSKEAAVTLPAMLLLSYLVFVGSDRRLFLKVFAALKASAIHLVLWGAYLSYIVGYLGVGGSDYSLSIGGNVARNLLNAVYYAFNLRRDGLMPERAVILPVLIFLVSFACLQIVLALWLLLRSERRLVVFGFLWFVIAVTPMLLLNHSLGPYYLFLAMVGFSLIAGLALNVIYRWLHAPAVAAVLIMIWLSCRLVISADTNGDPALGVASTWAENSMQDMLEARSDLPAGTNIYLLDQAVPDLWRFQGLGNLFKLVYQDDSVITGYRSTGQLPKDDGSELVVMKAEDEHLTDVTTEFQDNPAALLGVPDEASIRYVDRPGVSLSVSPAEVVAGRDFYWLGAHGLDSLDLVVQYTVNDGPVAEGRFRLNPEGKVRFFVSELTPVGTFRFVRFRALSAPEHEWIKCDVTLRVLPPEGK